MQKLALELGKQLHIIHHGDLRVKVSNMDSNFKGSVNQLGQWTIEGTEGVIVVPLNTKWCVKLTLDYKGNWTATPLPAEQDDPIFVNIYDATNAHNLTRFAADLQNILAAYDDGLFKDIGEARTLFPNHHIFTLCVKFGDTADFADTEPGNMNPAEAIASWEAERVKGIYADKSNWSAMLTAVDTAERRLGRKCIKWVADPNPNNVPHIPEWADICQYGFDGSYDVSLARFTSIASLL